MPKKDQAQKNSLTAGEEIKAFVERYEHLDAEKREIADEQKHLMAEAKGRGFDTKILRKVIAERKRDKDDLAEEEALLELYRSALDMVIASYTGAAPEKEAEVI